MAPLPMRLLAAIRSSSYEPAARTAISTASAGLSQYQDFFPPVSRYASHPAIDHRPKKGSDPSDKATAVWAGTAADRPAGGDYCPPERRKNAACRAREY